MALLGGQRRFFIVAGLWIFVILFVSAALGLRSYFAQSSHKWRLIPQPGSQRVSRPNVLRPTATVVRERYGKPLAEASRARSVLGSVSEIYLVRPRLTMTVTYDDTGQVCKQVIAPQDFYGLSRIVGSQYVISDQLLDEIVNEVAPPTYRGILHDNAVLDVACLSGDRCGGVAESYQYVMIYRYGGMDSHPFAEIQWRDGSCKLWEEPPNQPSATVQE
jgi:hypothetical protein